MEMFKQISVFNCNTSKPETTRSGYPFNHSSIRCSFFLPIVSTFLETTYLADQSNISWRTRRLRRSSFASSMENQADISENL